MISLGLVISRRLFQTTAKLLETEMSLDLLLFRADQGGNPDQMRDIQAKRYKDVKHVDQVVDIDTKWRKR